MEVKPPLLLLPRFTRYKQDRSTRRPRSASVAKLKQLMPRVRELQPASTNTSSSLSSVIDKACHMLMWDAGEVYDRRAVEFLKG